MPVSNVRRSYQYVMITDKNVKMSRHVAGRGGRSSGLQYYCKGDFVESCESVEFLCRGGVGEVE